MAQLGGFRAEIQLTVASQPAAGIEPSEAQTKVSAPVGSEDVTVPGLFAQYHELAGQVTALKPAGRPEAISGEAVLGPL